MHLVWWHAAVVSASANHLTAERCCKVNWRSCCKRLQLRAVDACFYDSWVWQPQPSPAAVAVHSALLQESAAGWQAVVAMTPGNHCHSQALSAEGVQTPRGLQLR